MNKHIFIQRSENIIQKCIRGSIDEKEMESFFHYISLPTLKEEERESLEAPLTKGHILSIESFPIWESTRQ